MIVAMKDVRPCVSSVPQSTEDHREILWGREKMGTVAARTKTHILGHTVVV